MAADGVNKLILLLVHGQRKYNLSLELSPEEAGNILTVKHLSTLVEESSGVPFDGQKLIFKGKSLSDPELSLTKLGLQNNSKIMLIGKKPMPQDDVKLAKLKTVEDTIERHMKKLSEITYELDGVDKGFLQDDLRLPALRHLSKNLSSVIEGFMKQMETLDGLNFSEGNNDARGRRKGLVDKIQKLLDRSDGLSSGVCELITRLDS